MEGNIKGPQEEGVLCRKQRRDSPGRPSRGLSGQQSSGQTFHTGAGVRELKRNGSGEASELTGCPTWFKRVEKSASLPECLAEWGDAQK